MNAHPEHATKSPGGPLDAEFHRHIAGRTLHIPYDRASGSVLSLASRPIVGSFGWKPASGQAQLRSFTVVWPPIRTGNGEPYPVVWVELAEGIRLISTTSGIALDALRIGMALRASFEESGRLVFVTEGLARKQSGNQGNDK